MTGDPTTRREQARAVLDFWFALTPQQHFAKNDALDRTIATRFGDWSDTLVATGAEGYFDDPDATLAAVIGLDQFTRNIHRGSPAAFAGDPIAQALTLMAVDRGWDDRLPPERRLFLYMPLMHAEDAALQKLSVEKFGALGIEENLDFAIAHCDAITQFGRFPGRNTALGRVSSAAEKVWLEENGGGW